MPRIPQKTKLTKPWSLSDDLWEELQPLIPKHKNTHRFGGGRPRVSDRTAMRGILFVLSTGCQWKALDDTGICSGSTAHSRFQEWNEAGVFCNLWTRGLKEYDRCRGIQWRWQSMDGAMTKAPLGGGKNRGKPDRSSQAGRQA
jgi:putative transposase